MENNKENKAKFFAQYYGVNVLAFHPNGDINSIKIQDLSWHYFRDNFEHSQYLQLRPISSITDEEAVEVATLCGWEKPGTGCKNMAERGIDCVKSFNIDFHLSTMAYDYLRSKGFALPYHDLSVDTMIEYGWIKLT